MLRKNTPTAKIETNTHLGKPNLAEVNTGVAILVLVLFPGMKS